MRRKTMGGKRKNKSSKAQRRMKKMVGGALVTGNGIVIDKPNGTLTVEFGEYEGSGPRLYNNNEEEGQFINTRGVVGSDHNTIITAVGPNGKKWSLDVDGTKYNLSYDRYDPPKTSGGPNGKFVFTIES